MINAELYMHPQDRETLRTLKSLPGFTALLQAFMKRFTGQMLHGVNMATKIRLGKDQLPEIYELLPPICDRLGIAEPELYLEMNPYPNAYTYGDDEAFITITSGLIDSMTTEELKAVIAHECGHIACRHVLYRTMATVILYSVADALGLGIISAPLKIALASWQRTSELSADRAAAVYMGGSEIVEDVMIRLASGSKTVINGINKEAFMEQAADYEKLVKSSGYNRSLQQLANLGGTHPFISVRCSEIHRWCQSAEFADIINGRDKPETSPEEISAENGCCRECGTKLMKGARFCHECGARQ